MHTQNQVVHDLIFIEVNLFICATEESFTLRLMNSLYMKP